MNNLRNSRFHKFTQYPLNNSRTQEGTRIPFFAEMSERRQMRKNAVEAKLNAGRFGKAE